jgi:hypothetical protein
MAVSPFDVVKSIFKKEKLQGEPITKDYSKWMVNKIFSCDQQLAILANELNNEFVSNQMSYDCYFFGIPKNPSKYIPYLAKKAAAEKEMKYFMEYFGVNQNVAKQYQLLIGDDEKKTIAEFFENRGAKKK